MRDDDGTTISAAHLLQHDEHDVRTTVAVPLPAVFKLPRDTEGPDRFGSFEQDSCAICLGKVSRPVELGCGHCFCYVCLASAASSTRKCPLCRKVHILDPAALKSRRDSYREGYQNWRRGGAHGARGEVSGVAHAKLGSETAALQNVPGKRTLIAEDLSFPLPGGAAAHPSPTQTQEKNEKQQQQQQHEHSTGEYTAPDNMPPDLEMPLPLDFDSVALLMTLPLNNMIIASYSYAALPLYFLDMAQHDSWFTLTKFGVIILAGNGGRIIVSAIVNRVGDWTFVPAIAVSLSATVWMCVSPSSVPAMFLAMALAQSVTCTLSLHGLTYARFNTGPGASSNSLHRRALRILTTFEVLGYSCAMVIGGLLYGLGGWGACSWFQCACQFLQLVMATGSKSVRGDFRTTWHAARNRKDVSEPNSAQLTLEHCDFPERLRRAAQTNALLRDIRWATFFVAAAHFVNIGSRSVEWSLFAAFFRHEFPQDGGWWTYFTQSLGDLLATCFLIFNMPTCGTCTCSGLRSRSKLLSGTQDAAGDQATGEGKGKGEIFVAMVTSQPYDISVLLLAVVLLNVLIAMPSFTCAVIAQVLGGTVYVIGALPKQSPHLATARPPQLLLLMIEHKKKTVGCMHLNLRLSVQANSWSPRV